MATYMSWVVLLYATMSAPPALLSAQPKLTLTVDDAVRPGRENSTTLFSARMKIQYADAKLAETNAARLPGFSAGGSSAAVGFTRRSAPSSRRQDNE